MVIGALIVLMILYGFLARPVPVDMAKASLGPMRETIEEEGKTRVKDRFVISAPVAGFMRRIRLKAGDPVNKDQTLIELEPLRSGAPDPRSRAAAEAVVSAAKAALKAAEQNARGRTADADYAKTSLNRIRKLFETGSVSADSMEQAVTAERRAEAARLAAEEAVKVSRFDLDRALTELRNYDVAGGENRNPVIEIRAPAGGRILKVHRESEGVVSPGEPLIDIGDPGRLEVEVEVLSADAVKMSPGTPVLFERWGRGEALSGKVRVVEPSGFTKISSLGVEEQRVLVVAELAGAPSDETGLGDGYRLDAQFIIWEGTDILQIPASALFRKGEKWAVFVVRNKTAYEQEVEVGHRNGLTAEILSGLSEGSEVIAHPDDLVTDGVRVRPR